MHTYLHIEQSQPIVGQTALFGAKNAVLVIMVSLLLTHGKSRLMNVPASADVLHMIILLSELGAEIHFDQINHILEIDTTCVHKWSVLPALMKKTRASILILGPLLARFSKAEIALSGGDIIGARPIDYHLKNLQRMGVVIEQSQEHISARVEKLKASYIVLEYPSVGATENLMMAAVLAQGTTQIINAALEPEVIDLITVLQKMGALIRILPPATIEITGVATLNPIEHTVIVDRLEAGALLFAAAVTGGSITITNALSHNLDIVLLKLQEMGHQIIVNENKGITLHATKSPRAVSFKTGPYPQFPTDLQAPMLALQTVAEGKSYITETVWENRLMHTRELQKMGAQIKVEYDTAIINGVEELYGTQVIASDIRASCALVLAGLVATGPTIMTGVYHWQRGYDALERKLALLGAAIEIRHIDEAMMKLLLGNQLNVNLNS